MIQVLDDFYAGLFESIAGADLDYLSLRQLPA